MMKTEKKTKYFRIVLTALFVMTSLSSIYYSFGDNGGSGISPSTTRTFQPSVFRWKADHETGDLSEYSWMHAREQKCGSFSVVRDAPDSGKGFVYRGEITCAHDDGNSHRLYPVLLIPGCFSGAYRSHFDVWADIPDSYGDGWISLATYTNEKNWTDLFGINLGRDKDGWHLTMFHVPVFGKGEFVRVQKIPFPLREWVKIDVTVQQDGTVFVLQNGSKVMSAKKTWGKRGPGLCEAHWGLYAQGKVGTATLLNDNIMVIEYAGPEQ